MLGRPTRRGPVEIQTLDLNTLQSVQLYGGDLPIPKDATLPRGCSICLRLTLSSETASLNDSSSGWRDIPFTDLELAQQWRDHLLGQKESADQNV